jgi:pimeloyl-ACP methyl ester carboxylesterase
MAQQGIFVYNNAMIKKLPFSILTFLGLFLALGSIITVAVIDRPLANRQSVTFIASTGDSLVGTYYPGTEPAGVILLEGFGSDQVTMTSLASEFARSGWHVFIFDFSGHGRSPGTLTFDNAQTDRLANQALSAMDEFEGLSGLRTQQIFVVGHSLGARVALQSATMNPEQVAGLVLLGTQVNLSTNVQSEFFTGTTDIDLPWVQALGHENPPMPILLVSGEWDDILTPENAELLSKRLGGDEAGNNRTLVILPAIVHNYEPFSSRVLLEITKWTNEIVSRSPDLFGKNAVDANVIVSGFDKPPVSAAARILCWVFGLIGILLSVTGGNRWLLLSGAETKQLVNLEIVNVKRFLWGKLLLWLGALPVAAILGSLFFVIPLGKPVFNLIYVGFIGGYGALLVILYWRGKMPGVQGKLPFVKEKMPIEWKRVLAALGIVVGMLGLTVAYARTGWYYVFPLNVRLIWLVIFTPFTALGFWIGLHEAQMLPQRRGTQMALTLIGLFPFFLYTLLMASLGSLSGMIGGLQGLIILWLVLAFGNLVQTVGRRPWMTAVCMAVLLYWLILPQGVLF